MPLSSLTTRLMFATVFILGGVVLVIDLHRGDYLFVLANILVLAGAGVGWYGYEMKQAREWRP